MCTETKNLTKTVFLALVLASAAACSGEAVTEPESGLPWSGPELPMGGSPAADDSTEVSYLDPAVVGNWTRLLLFTDVDGTQRGSRLTFDLRSDSTFTRTLVTSNFTLGIDDTVIESGRWFTLGGNLTLRYNPNQPDERISRFSYRLIRRSDGNQVLLLDDSGFVRN